MDFDLKQAWIDQQREIRKTPRERDIEREIAQIIQRHREAIVAECAPLHEELAQIEARKPPMPILHDGKIYEYVGPAHS